MMKKICTRLVLMAGVVAVMLFAPAILTQAESNRPSRQINLVYDDSGSMIKTDGKKVDTWCQAKYSMEVFASMLGEKDTLNIYVMSDYITDDKAKPRLTLQGKSGARVNVDKVHQMITEAGNTPFNAVRKANRDLKGAKADEKWLVILTDGEFDDFKKESDKGREKIDDFLSKKEADVNVMFFGMGADAAEVSEVPSQNIFCARAKNSGEILNEVTQICSRIFNNDKLEVNKEKKSLSFDVPMSQLIVFAQGKDVSIKGLKDSGGKKIAPSDDPVTVQYSTKAATNHDDPKIDKNLKGCVGTFTGDIPAGDYSLDVDGADTIEVYYTPNIDIMVNLKNAKGEKVTNIEELETGDYTIEFGFVKAGTTEKVKESALLGDIEYNATVTNNGQVHDKEYHSGDKIHLEEGDLKIDVTATFLEYNSVSSHIEYTIYKNKGIGFRIEKDQQYYQRAGGLSCIADDDKFNGQEPEPILVRATIDGRDFTADEWKKMDTLTVETDRRASLKANKPKGFFGRVFHRFRKFNTVKEVKLEKTNEPGLMKLTPVTNKNRTGTYSDTRYVLRAYGQQGKAVWKGEMEDAIKITDRRSIVQRDGPTLIRIAISALILLLLLGFTPLFKKRFPKSMKASPTITCRPVPYGRATEAHGRFKKDGLSSMLPFVAETGMLRFVPSGTAGIPAMKLKAGGGSKLIIMNTKAFAGKKNFYIDSQQVEKGTTKLLTKAPTMQIEVKTDVMNYTCVPRN